MNSLLWVHIAAGCLALVAGTVAVVASKGGSLHARAGTGFVASMLVLGTTASLLEPFRTPPGSPVGGIIICYFAATAWMTARRRDGRPGRFEMIACALALGSGALTALGGFTGAATTPVGPAPVFVFSGICLLAGLGDLSFVRRGRLTVGRRLSRHVWRMCVAFFIATGSFFLGQQGAMPAAVRGSLLLFVPAFAPFAVMIFWLVRIRFPNAPARLKLRVPQAADTEKGGVEPVSKRRAAA